ncbi:MAG: FmdB family zinc ribbon protein [Methylobacter sp.]
MPTYEYKCPSCGSEIIRIMSMKDHKNIYPCECGAMAKQVINHAPMLVIPEHMKATGSGGYQSPIDGRPITSAKARIEDLARNGCIEYDPGMKQDADRRVKEQDEALDKAIDQTVEKEIEAMPTIKKERLTAELQNGANAEIARL